MTKPGQLYAATSEEESCQNSYVELAKLANCREYKALESMKISLTSYSCIVASTSKNSLGTTGYCNDPHSTFGIF